MEQKTIIGYMRVSTQEQNEDRQRLALIRMGVPEQQIYMDKQSGKDFERPQYKKMLRKLNYCISIIKLYSQAFRFAKQVLVISFYVL